MVYRPIQIKYSVASNNVPTLIPGELAFTQAGNNFFIGAPDGSAGNIRIGHRLNDGILTANQALVANSTGGINRLYTSEIDTTNLSTQVIHTDQIYTRTIDLNYLAANGSSGESGYILITSNTGVYWAPITTLIGNLQISDTGSVSANNIIADGNVSSNNIFSKNIISYGNVSSNNVISNTVTTGIVNTDNINSNNVNTNNVNSDNVTTNNINSNNVNTNNVNSNTVTTGIVNTDNITSNSILTDTITVNHIIANGFSGNSKYILTSSGPSGNVYWANAIPDAPYYYSNQMYDYTQYGIGWMNLAPNQNAETLGFRTDVTVPFGAVWILAINDGLDDPAPITIYSPSTRTTPMLWMSIDGTGPFDPDTNPHGQAYWFNITPPPSGA